MTGGTTAAYPLPSPKALLIEIRRRLRLVLGRNMPFPHSKVRAWAGIVEYEPYIFGLALVIVGVVNGRGDAEPSIGSVLDEQWSRMCISCEIVDDLLIRSRYHYRRCGRPDALCQRWRSCDVVGR